LQHSHFRNLKVGTVNLLEISLEVFHPVRGIHLGSVASNSLPMAHRKVEWKKSRTTPTRRMAQALQVKNLMMGLRNQSLMPMAA
jgi:hypothetical protein